MHELALAATIIESALEHAGSLARIDEVHVSVGCLVMASPEQLAFGFETLSVGTAAGGARLIVETTPVLARCASGHETRAMIAQLGMESLMGVLECPQCGEPADIVEGREIVLTRIVGEERPPAAGRT